jgi:hypothetical protein
MSKRSHHAAFDATTRLSFLRSDETDLTKADDDTLRAVAEFRERKQIEVFGQNVPAPLPQFESSQFQGVQQRTRIQVTAVSKGTVDLQFLCSTMHVQHIVSRPPMALRSDDN